MLHARTTPSNHVVPVNPRQYDRFFAAPTIAPLPASTPLSELSTHESKTQISPHLNMTIKLINSQCPKGGDLTREKGLFFFPGKVMGEIVLELVNKSVEEVDSLIISVRLTSLRID